MIGFFRFIYVEEVALSVYNLKSNVYNNLYHNIKQEKISL